jgi:hypothetical protein
VTWIVGPTASQALALFCIGVGLAEIGMAVLWWRRRAFGRAGTMLACAVVMAAVVTLQWWLHGACLLPHPAVVDFYNGMTLCPGQSAIIRGPPVEQRGL